MAKVLPWNFPHQKWKNAFAWYLLVVVEMETKASKWCSVSLKLSQHWKKPKALRGTY